MTVIWLLVSAHWVASDGPFPARARAPIAKVA